MDGNPKNGRVDVWVYVHNLSHSPVAFAAVYAVWSGAYSASVSCPATSAGGACYFRSGAVPSGAAATLTVTGVTYGANSYNAALNHDAEPDSNGTSISVVAN